MKLDKKKIFNIKPGIDNFAILLKGGSLDKLKKYKNNFSDCFIVSDYDDELEVLGNDLIGKNIIHFRNRERNSSLKKENYIKYKIKYVQLGQVCRWNHFELIKSYFDYKFMNINIDVSFLPEEMRHFNDDFDKQYKLKFPNTGILSILFALQIIRPKNLWIFGLDFYAVNYYTKQIKNPNSHNPLEKRKGKMDRLNLDGYVKKMISNFSETKFYIASYYQDWPEYSNMTLIN